LQVVLIGPTWQVRDEEASKNAEESGKVTARAEPLLSSVVV